MRRDVIDLILFIASVSLAFYLTTAISVLILLTYFLIHLLPNSLLYLTIGCLASTFFVFIVLRRVKVKSAVRFISGFTLVMMLFWLTFQAVLVVTIEAEYNNIQMHYSAEYSELKNETNELSAIWHIVNEYKKEFDTSTYGNRNAVIPSRVVSFNPILAPILGIYFIEYDGPSKLIVVQKKGNCGEFAEAVSFLLSDLTGLPTRIVSFEGIDHAFPEVNIEGKWWVLDKLWTTKERPVEACQYYAVLKAKGLAKYVANLVEKDSNRSVLSEHGFRPVNLTIFAISDMTIYETDDTPAAGAEIEVFAPLNHYDPLVAKGRTDGNGRLYVVLKSQKDYVIIAKTEKSGTRAVGIIIINSKELDAPNKTVKIYLHKYE